jgi:hypothetical protein
MTAYEQEELSVSGVAEELYKKARLRSHIAEEREARLRVLRETRRVTPAVAAALFVLDRRLRRQQERLFGKVDRDL